MDGVSAPDIGDARFGQAKKAHLASGDQLAHHARHLFHRHHRIDAMLVEQVDAVGLKPPQGALDRLADVRRSAVALNAHLFAVLDAKTEFGGQNDLVAPSLQRPTQQLSLIHI